MQLLIFCYCLGVSGKNLISDKQDDSDITENLQSDCENENKNEVRTGDRYSSGAYSGDDAEEKVEKEANETEF